MREAIVAAVVLAIAALAVWQAALLPFGGAHAPGPGFFPLWTSIVIGVLAVILLSHARRAPASRPATDRADRAAHALVKVVMLGVVLGAYAVALDPLGYPISTFLLVVFMLRVLEPHAWSLALGMAASTAVASYVLFAVWLRVPLPPGPFGH